ncbi:hypothetical protein DA718_09065 [Klebsiella huaxiensis]|nr:hypothetical protein DA718_09065 [Klebsiella huaxiensis]
MQLLANILKLPSRQELRYVPGIVLVAAMGVRRCVTHRNTPVWRRGTRGDANFNNYRCGYWILCVTSRTMNTNFALRRAKSATPAGEQKCHH